MCHNHQPQQSGPSLYYVEKKCTYRDLSCPFAFELKPQQTRPDIHLCCLLIITFPNYWTLCVLCTDLTSKIKWTITGIFLSVTVNVCIKSDWEGVLVVNQRRCWILCFVFLVVCFWDIWNEILRNGGGPIWRWGP